MQAAPGPTKRPFLDRANDLDARDLPSRLSRFLRSRLRRLCQAGTLLADDPRVLLAWRRHWDALHFIQLRRWKAEGFQPRVVYDIGAYQGLWAEMCQHIFAPSRCFLFEPQPEMRERAKARAARVGAGWQILPVALGDRRETQVLHVTRNNAASSLLPPLGKESAAISDNQAVAESRVQVMPLDELVAADGLPAPDLVKIDVQGFEGRVLAGGKETLRKAQRLVIEVSLHPLYDGQSLLPEILQTLSSWGLALQDVNETLRQWPGRLWQVDLWLQQKTTHG